MMVRGQAVGPGRLPGCSDDGCCFLSSRAPTLPSLGPCLSAAIAWGDWVGGFSPWGTRILLQASQLGPPSPQSPLLHLPLHMTPNPPPRQSSSFLGGRGKARLAARGCSHPAGTPRPGPAGWFGTARAGGGPCGLHRAEVRDGALHLTNPPPPVSCTVDFGFPGWFGECFWGPLPPAHRDLPSARRAQWSRSEALRGRGTWGALEQRTRLARASLPAEPQDHLGPRPVGDEVLAAQGGA